MNGRGEGLGGGWLDGRAGVAGCGSERRGVGTTTERRPALPNRGWSGRKANLGAHEPRCQGRGAPYCYHATCLPSAHLPHTPATDRHHDKVTRIHNSPKGRKLRMRENCRFLRASGSNYERICMFFPSISLKTTLIA